VKPPALFLKLITCGEGKVLLNKNLKALFVIEVLPLLPAFAVPLEILTFGIEVLPNLLSAGWLRCVCALQQCLSLKTKTSHHQQGKNSHGINA